MPLVLDKSHSILQSPLEESTLLRPLARVMGIVVKLDYTNVWGGTRTYASLARSPIATFRWQWSRRMGQRLLRSWHGQFSYHTIWWLLWWTKGVSICYSAMHQCDIYIGKISRWTLLRCLMLIQTILRRLLFMVMHAQLFAKPQWLSTGKRF